MTETRPRLDPTLVVVARPDGHVQLGIDPRRAVLVRPPAPLDSADLHRVLQRLDGTAGLAALCADLAVPAEPVAAVVAALGRAGVLVDPPGSTRLHPRRKVLLVGAGPLADQLATVLAGRGVVLERNQRPTDPAVGRWREELVVLTDAVIGRAPLIQALHEHRVPHLAVQVRDGIGVVGPLVLPGRTSCLRCADLHRTDRDPAWPQLVRQLRRHPGPADPATVLATAGAAAVQIDRHRDWAAGRPGAEPPVAIDHTVEVDLSRPAIIGRRWTVHRLCACGAGGSADLPADRTGSAPSLPDRAESATMAECPKYPAAESPAPPAWPHCPSVSPDGPRPASVDA